MSIEAAAAPRGRTILLILLAWLASYMGIRLYLESGIALSSGVRLTLALLPSPLFAAFLWTFVRGIRTADELERRIQLEALAVAFPLGLMLLTTLGLVQRAVELNFQDWSYNHVWPMFALFYLCGLVVARRRYA